MESELQKFATMVKERITEQLSKPGLARAVVTPPTPQPPIRPGRASSLSNAISNPHPARKVTLQAAGTQTQVYVCEHTAFLTSVGLAGFREQQGARKAGALTALPGDVPGEENLHPTSRSLQWGDHAHHSQCATRTFEE